MVDINTIPEGGSSVSNSNVKMDPEASAFQRKGGLPRSPRNNGTSSGGVGGGRSNGLDLQQLPAGEDRTSNLESAAGNNEIKSKLHKLCFIINIFITIHPVNMI